MATADAYAGAPRWRSLAIAARRWPTRGPLLAGAGMMAAGVALRASTFSYHGPAKQHVFNSFSYSHVGGYSDIASLYFRNHMWLHHLPYVDYKFEYPVGTGMFAWLMSLAGGGVGGYLALNAAALLICGLVTIWLVRSLPDANPWLLALSPALALYVVLNWDLLSIAALVLALVLFHRRRDGWGAATLGVATWTKFFPIIALPVVLLVRILDAHTLRERVRACAVILVPFAAATVAINAPFLLVARGGWEYFFRFNATRGVGGSLWALITDGHVTSSTANLDSTALTLAGIAVILLAAVWASRRGERMHDLLMPLVLASVAWFFFAIKSYSPQYDLWVVVLLAAAGAPLALTVAFAAADIGFFVTAFTWLRLLPREQWFVPHILRPAIALREAAMLAIVAWAVWAVVERRRVLAEVSDASPIPAKT